MNALAGACRYAAGAVWVAVSTLVGAPVKWAIALAMPGPSTPLETEWRVLLPPPPYRSPGSPHRLYSRAIAGAFDDDNYVRLWWDALPETSAHLCPHPADDEDEDEHDGATNSTPSSRGAESAGPVPRSS
jgi:hypothetical protein